MIKGQEWRDYANCLGMDPNDFFDKYEESAEIQLLVDNTCANCVVREQCLQWAIDNNFEGGVMGRKYFSQSIKQKRKRKKKNAVLQD